MSWLALGLAAVGWLLALSCASVSLVLRRRLELVAQAEHELRGPVTAIGLAVMAMRREPGGRRRALALESQLDRMGTGLADLEAARRGVRAPDRPTTIALEGALRGAAAAWRPAAQSEGRRLRMTWQGVPAAVRADPGRLAQALGNLLANALEHGSGPVELRGRTVEGRALVEVRDAGPAQDGKPAPSNRGRGLAIADRAARDAGGRVALGHGDRGTVAVVELPLRDEGGPAAS